MPSLATSPDASAHQARVGLSPYAGSFAVFLCGTFAFLDLYCVQPLLPLFSQVFHASETRVGLTISASTLGVAVSAVLLALFGEHLNRRRTILISMIALALCTLLTSTATGLTTLVFWRLLQGLITPGIFIITIAYITEEWPALLVPRVMSTYVAGTIFGGFIGRLLAGIIATQLSWRSVFFLLGLAGLCGAAATYRLLPQEPARTGHVLPASRFAPFLANLRNPRLLATFTIGFCMLFTLVSTFSFITFYLSAAPFHLSTSEISYVFAVYLVGLTATLAAGTVLARVGLRNGMLVAVCLSLIGLAFTLIHHLTVVALGLAVVSSGVFISQACANSFLRDAAPIGSRVSAAGLYVCSYYIGGTFGGLLPGIAWHYAGWPGCVAFTAAFLVAAGLIALLGWPAHTPEPNPLPS